MMDSTTSTNSSSSEPHPPLHTSSTNRTSQSSTCSPFFTPRTSKRQAGHIAVQTFDFSTSLPSTAPLTFASCPKWRDDGRPWLTTSRHLCSNLCFYKSYLPARKWYALVDAVEGRGLDAAVILEGWAARLSDEAGACGSTGDASHGVVRVDFYAPNGDAFPTASAVCSALKIELDEGGRNGGGGLRRFPRAVIEAEIKKSTSWADIDPRNGSNKRLALLISSPPLTTESPARTLWPGKSFIFTPSRSSPFGLLEEITWKDPWRLLLTCILLNRTTRRQVDPVLTELLSKYGTCDALVEEATQVGLALILRPCGMHLKRSQSVLDFSGQYKGLVDGGVKPEELTEEQVRGFASCGDYAWDAYRIFVLNLGVGEGEEHNFEPQDHALKMYVGWKRGTREAAKEATQQLLTKN